MRFGLSRYWAVSTLILGVTIWAAVPARANLYLKYGTIQGDVTAAGYEKTIAVEGFSLGVGRGVGSPTGGSADRESSAPVFSQVAISALGSSASVPMFEEAVQGEAQDATIYITKFLPPIGSQVTYAQWDFKNTLVASFSTGSGGDTPVDSYSLSPTSYTYTWTNYDAKGAQTGKLVYGYDLATAKATVTASGDTTGFAFVTSVPEPASLATLLLAAPIFLMRRRA